MRVEGACHCGAIRFEAEVDPSRVVLCHCGDCQTLSGAPFRTVAQALPGSLRLLEGEPRTYVKRAESGRERVQAFCGTCGTPLWSAPPGQDGTAVGLRAGALRQRAPLVPRVQYWTRPAVPWLGDLPALKRLETQPGFGADGNFGDR